MYEVLIAFTLDRLYLKGEVLSKKDFPDVSTLINRGYIQEIRAEKVKPTPTKPNIAENQPTLESE